MYYIRNKWNAEVYREEGIVVFFADYREALQKVKELGRMYAVCIELYPEDDPK